VGDEEREGAARSQHVVLQGPADARTMAAAMRSGVERSREIEGTAAPGCLIITPSVEQALSASEQARILLANDTSRVVPVSQVARARRVLAAGPVAVVTGTAADLLSLRRDSALQVDAIRAVIIVGLDDVLAEGDVAALEALLGDMPADATRVATLEHETPAVEAFLEAQLRRARRIAPPPAADAPLTLTPSYLLTSSAGRAEALRAVLDAVDPPSVVVVASNEPSAAEATRALARLGLVVDGLLVQVVRQPTSQHVSLVVLWDAPGSAEALAESLATHPVDAVAFLSPEELPAFRRLTHGTAAAWAPPGRKARVATRVERLRTAIRETLLTGGGATASELSLLTPLLDTFDAVEIAAASLRLYEGSLRDVALAKAAATQAAARATAPSGERGARGLSVVQGGAGSKQRVFLAVGKRDDVRVGDIVGAVANEAGIDGDRIGSVEMYESHTTVELSADDAARAVTALADATLRGRRLSARIDERGDRGASGEKRPPRTFGPPRSGPRPERGDRAERPPMRGKPPARNSDTRGESRGEPRGDARSAGRSDSRGDSRGDARDTRGGSRGGPPRGNFGGATEARRAFGDRPARERTEGTSEWSQRGERMKHAKRTPRERPEPNSEA
jgi:ATP-dependent RNA helicase DeaD